jgi:alkylation response protein AidB-like acyl-CoA dehydrogenase
MAIDHRERAGAAQAGEGSSDIVATARGLADEFRPAAEALDRTGTFPFEHYQRLRDTGYVRALAPEQLGGRGAGLLEMAKAQQALARGCASTALAINMHHFQVGFAADGWRKTGSEAVGKLLRRVAHEGIVLASTGAESVVPGAWSTPAVAEREDGGYRVTGHKYFCSQASGMDVVRVNARDTVTGEILVCSVPTAADGVRVVQTWDTMGMRATASHDLVLEHVWVPLGAVGARLPADAPMRHPAMAGAATWFLSLLSSVYLGIAEEARAEALRALGTGGNTRFRPAPLTDVLIGQMEAAFQTAQAVRDQVVGQLDQDRSDAQAAVARAILCRQVVVSQAQVTLQHAVAIVGGRAYFRTSPLERLARDMAAGQFHPPAEPTSFQMLGERIRQASTG